MRIALCLLLLCASAFADSLVVTSTAYIEDHYIASNDVNGNFGNSTLLRLNGPLIGRAFRIRIHGVDTIMDGVGATAIDSAFMMFYVAGARNCGGYASYAVRRVLKPFFEGDGTIGDDHPAGGTYSHWRDSTGSTSDSGYSTAGVGGNGDSVDNRGDHARPDRWTTAIATLTGVASGWQRVNITTTARQYMGDTIQENGYVVNLSTFPCNDGNEFINDTVLIYSSEYTTDTSLTPRFVFYYTPSAPPAVTEPPRYRQGPAGAEVRQGPTGASKRTGP